MRKNQEKIKNLGQSDDDKSKWKDAFAKAQKKESKIVEEEFQKQLSQQEAFFKPSFY